MNLSGLGSLLTVATSLLGGAGGGGPLGIAGSIAGSLLGGGASGAGSSSAGASDPFSAIMNLTQDVDQLATSGLGSFAGGAFAGGAFAGGGASGLPGSISGLLA